MPITILTPAPLDAEYYEGDLSKSTHGFNLWWQQVGKKLLTEFKARPCAICQQRFPACAIDIHHTDPRVKTRKALSTLNYADLVLELRSCVPLCACCHRIWHAATKRNQTVEEYLADQPHCSAIASAIP